MKHSSVALLKENSGNKRTRFNNDDTKFCGSCCTALALLNHIEGWPVTMFALQEADCFISDVYFAVPVNRSIGEVNICLYLLSSPLWNRSSYGDVRFLSLCLVSM